MYISKQLAEKPLPDNVRHKHSFLPVSHAQTPCFLNSWPSWWEVTSSFLIQVTCFPTAKYSAYGICKCYAFLEF